jgi:hypothetical protein
VAKIQASHIAPVIFLTRTGSALLEILDMMNSQKVSKPMQGASNSDSCQGQWAVNTLIQR